MASRALQEATLLVLTALSRGSRHGHGIIADVQEISGGRVKLRAGTLYTALDQLRAAGLVAVDREEIVANRPRRYYQLIPAPRTSSSPHSGTSSSPHSGTSSSPQPGTSPLPDPNFAPATPTARQRPRPWANISRRAA